MLGSIAYLQFYFRTKLYDFITIVCFTKRSSWQIHLV